MLKGLIGTVELGELAGRNGSLEQRLRSCDLPRLVRLTPDDALGPSSGLDAVAEFLRGPEGFPVMRLRITGTWPLVCQRCLSAAPCVIDIDSELTILQSETDSERVADPFDCVILEAEGLRLLEVIEDEVLAALPMAPVHRADDLCAAAGGESPKPDTIEEKANKPFAGLAELMDSTATDTTG